MYYSPIPLLVIRADTPALIEVNGHPAGECGPQAHIALPLSDSGDYYITLLPLGDDPCGRLYPVARKISFLNGTIKERPAKDVSVCAWPGGVYELTMRAGKLRCSASCRMPHPIDRIEPHLEGHSACLTLYYENGLKLSLEEDGRTLGGYALGDGEGGSLNLVELAGQNYIAARTHGAHGQRLLLLNSALEEALDVTAAAIDIEADHVAVTDPIGTLLGHERRVCYHPAGDGTFAADGPEVGFFTGLPRIPHGTMERAVAFAEAVREGFAQEAMGYLAEDLALSVTFEALKEFFGDFTAVRPPISDRSGHFLGLIAQEEGNLSCARLYEFEFTEDGQIENITEA